MDNQRGNVSKAKAALQAKNRFAGFAYKPKAKLVPFGLEETTAPLLSEILAEDASLTDTVKSLMSQAKSAGTMDCYERMTKKFAKFCDEKRYDYPGFTEKAALHFVIQLDKDGATMSSLCQVKPALSLVEKLSGHKESSFTDMVDTMLNAAKRRAAETKPAVMKAGVLPEDVLQRLFPVHYSPHVENTGNADPVMLRTFVRSIVVYFTFCRFNCYSRLRAMDIEDDGQSIQINFPSAKNDQMHKGKTTCLVMNDTEINPVAILRMYFRLCKFKFGAANGDTSLLNCVIRRNKKGWYADGRRGISYSAATKNLRAMMSSIGVNVDRLTDKSVKMLGVTKSLDSGMNTDEVMHQGRWKTASMPLHYKINSTQFKEKIASHVPV